MQILKFTITKPILLIPALAIFWSISCSSKNSIEKPSYQMLFLEICEIIENNFYDFDFIENRFPQIKSAYHNEINSITTETEFTEFINKLLAELNTSHTNYYTPVDQEYYHLASIFRFLPNIKELFDHKEIQYPSIGIITEEIEGKLFIASVLAGSIAEKAGLHVGDEIVSADGKSYFPILSLQNKKEVDFEIRRQTDQPTFNISVKPSLVNPHEEYLDAEQNSIRIYESEGKKIGYIHIWSYAGEEFHEVFVDAIRDGELKSVDALIWDLRYGWGGASPDYLNIFNKNVPSLSMFDREGHETIFNARWDKPVVMLTNDRVRSGKELLAFGFKKYKLGTIVGEKTAGATTAGKLFVLSNKALLYLAVMDSKIDGVRLEGVGVEPDIHVPMNIRYCDGKDMQVGIAIEYLADEIQ